VTAFPPTELKKPAEVGQLFQLLNDPDEKTRADAVIQLGRLKLDQAVDPICATLASDKSPVVRDSAAKALGLIGATRSLTALLHASQADPDNDVRRSASFAVEIIKLNNNLK
jgi:HEAT repeat protein